MPVPPLLTLASLLLVPPFTWHWQHVNVHDHPVARLVGAIDFTFYVAVRSVPESCEEAVGNLVGRELVRGLRKGMTPEEVQAVMGRRGERGCVGLLGEQVEEVTLVYHPEGISVSFSAHGTRNKPVLDRVMSFSWSPLFPWLACVPPF
jgi:hypothetical protein